MQKPYFYSISSKIPIIDVNLPLFILIDLKVYILIQI